MIDKKFFIIHKLIIIYLHITFCTNLKKSVLILEIQLKLYIFDNKSIKLIRPLINYEFRKRIQALNGTMVQEEIMLRKSINTVVMWLKLNGANPVIITTRMFNTINEVLDNISRIHY